MSKLGDMLREAAALVDRDDIAGIGFVQVGDWGWQLAIAKSSDAESDAKKLALCLGQAAENFEPNVRRPTVEELEVILSCPESEAKT